MIVEVHWTGFWTGVRFPSDPLNTIESNPRLKWRGRFYFRVFPGCFAVGTDIPDEGSGDATYEEIKSWVAQNYSGMKVTKTCIANAKRRAGIEVEDHGVPPAHTPQKKTVEKENAVLAAFEHFNMI